MRWIVQLISAFFGKKEDAQVPPPASATPITPATPVPDRDPNRPVTIVDVYHNDVVVNWNLLKEQIDGIILKVSEADYRVDDAFQKFRAQAAQAGIPCGFYHFYRSDKSPELQAALFLKTIGDIKPGELNIVVCDWETEDDPEDGFDKDEVKRFQDIVEAKLGIIPWVYGGRLLKENAVPVVFARYPLWLSHYTNNPRPVVPAPWIKETLWQYTNKESCNGIKNPCDCSRFNGSYEDFKLFIKR